MTISKIIHKRSAIPGKVPSDLEYGELAINYADGDIFYKNVGNDLQSFSNITLARTIAKTPSAQVSSTRYQSISLAETEPDAGLPTLNNSLFASNVDGTRKWLKIGEGLAVDTNGYINVTTTLDATLVAVDSVGLGLTYTNGIKLDEVLVDIGTAFSNIVTDVISDNTLTGNGTLTSPMSVSGIFGSINIANRALTVTNVKLTNFLHNCFRIDPDSYRLSGFAKVYTKNNEPVNVLLA